MNYLEPWRSDPSGRLGITAFVRDNNGGHIAEIKREQADRIVLAVNFCAGVDDAVLEDLLNKGGLKALLPTHPDPKS